MTREMHATVKLIRLSHFVRPVMCALLALVLAVPVTFLSVASCETASAATDSSTPATATDGSAAGASTTDSSAAGASAASSSTSTTGNSAAGASAASSSTSTTDTSAQDSSTTTPNSDTITSSTKVRVGWFTSDLFQEGDEGEPKSGYGYAYLRKLADYTAWQYEYVYGEWSELYDMLCAGEIDVMGGMSYTAERESLMLFPDSAMESDEYYLFKRADDSSIKTGDLSTFAGKKIGVLYNNRITDFAQDWINSKGIDAELVYFDSFDDLHAALEAGEIDLEPRTLDGGSDANSISAVVNLGEEPSYLAVSRTRPDLLAELNSALSDMNVVEPYALQELQYDTYGSVYTSKTLTDTERTWLEAHSVIRVGYINNYLPYCATDADGNATGLMTDVIDALIASLELDSVVQIQYIAYESYQEVADALKTGTIDVGFPISDDAWTLEEDGISASTDVIADRGVLFYKTICNKESVKKIAATKGNVFQDEYTAISYPNAEIVYYSSVDKCLDAVVAGEADGTIMDSLRVQYVTNQSQYENLQYVQLNDVTGKCFGIAQGNKAALMLVNRGLKIIGTSYGYDRAFQYVDELTTYDVRYFLRENALGISILTCGFIITVIVLLVLYIRKQKRELAIKEKLKREAEEANAAKSRFLFNMSHDIRTPMNAVLGFNELMIKDIDNPDKLKDHIEKVRFSGEYLLELINNVLEVARIDSGKETLNEEFADLRDESYRIVLHNEAHKKQLTFEPHISVTHRYVYTDAQKIREIILNILSNAVKYTPEGGTIRLELVELTDGTDATSASVDTASVDTASVDTASVDTADASVADALAAGTSDTADASADANQYATYVCTISDTGIGMTKEFQEHLFDNFARERNTTESKVAGTGLGMAIVKKLVDLMGGTISVQSAPGEGSTFVVTMRLRIVTDPEKYLEQEKEAIVASDYDLTGKRILLTEDNELNVEIAKALLENLGAQVEVANNGIICIEMLQEHDAGYYDVILMDIQMPYLNGYDATKKIRALPNESKATIPIIAMTANAFDEDKKLAFEAGMNEHIAKPIDVGVLSQTLQALLG